MKKLILTIMMLASIQAYAGQDGGGGGVIKRDGMYLTFGSAGMKVNVGTPKGLEQIPGMDLLVSTLEANQGSIPDTKLGEVLRSTIPSAERKYFKVDNINEETYQRLIQEFAKLFKDQVNPENLDLAGFTIGQDTYLLPPFFLLKKQEEKAAFLFHEAIWVINPKSTYEDVVNAEMTMQAHMEKYGTKSVYNPDLILVMAKLLNIGASVVTEAINADLRSGTFKKYNISLGIGSGGNFIKNDDLYNLKSIFPVGSYASYNEFYMELRRAMVKYPDFKFLKILYALGTKLSGNSTYRFQAIPASGEFSLSESGSCVDQGDNGNFNVSNWSILKFCVYGL